MNSLDVTALQGAELYGEIDEKADRNGQQKEKHGLLGWRLQLLVTSEDGRVSRPVPVTVWAKRRPNVYDGDSVRFARIVCGAYTMGASAQVYVHAWGAEKTEPELTLGGEEVH